MTECLPDLPRYIRQRDNEWQGADHPDGPWRPIPAPQSGLSWKVDGPAVPESREPASVAAEASSLSPAAQAPGGAGMMAPHDPAPVTPLPIESRARLRLRSLGWALLAASPAAPPAPAVVPVAIPGEQWHEDDGACLWWRFPIEEPPWSGDPRGDDWPGYHTHFTRIVCPLPQGGEGQV